MAKSGYCSITLNNQSIVNNTSTITVAGIITTSGESYRGNHRTGTYSIYQGGTLIKSGSFTAGAPANSTSTLFSVTLTVSHKDDGSSGAITASYNYDSGWCSGSGSLPLKTIPRATTPELSDDDVNLGETIIIDLPRKSTVFTHTLQHDFLVGNWTTFAEKATTSASLNVPIDWANRMPARVRGDGRIRCLTYNGNTLIGEKIVVFYASVPDNIKPSCSIEIVDLNEYESKYGAFVQGKSKLNIKVTAEMAYSSPVELYSVSVDNRMYSKSEVETEIIQGSGLLDVIATVSDKRNRKGSATDSINVLEYDTPNINLLKVQRCDQNGVLDDQGAFVKVTIRANVAPLNNINTAAYVLEYKKTSESEYKKVVLDTITGIYTVVDYEVIFIADVEYSYDIRLSVTDDFCTVIRKTVVSTGFTTFDLNESGKGFSLGKLSEKDAFECAMDMYDRYDTRAENGLALKDDENELDPDYTMEAFIVTNKNTPGEIYMFIHTVFVNAKGEKMDRIQIGYPYEGTGSIKRRVYKNEIWSEWF